MLAANAARQCADQTAIADAILQLYRNPEARRMMTERAGAFLAQNQGATLRIADLLNKSWQSIAEKHA